MLGAILFVAVSVIFLTDLDDYLWNMNYHSAIDEETRKSSIWLPDYQADIVGLELSDIADNASGVTYDHERGSLWIVVDKPQSLYELDLQFNILRHVEIQDFKDTEAIAYAGGGTFIFTDEREKTVAIAEITDQTKKLERNLLRQLTVNLTKRDNKGLEGVTIDPATNTIYIVRERDPMKLVKIEGFMKNENRINVEDVKEIDVNDMHLDDLSGLHFDTNTNHLLILSHESKLLVEVDLDGNMMSYMELERGFNNLDSSIPQAEGVTMDADGNIYIVSEPNLIYRYKKTAN